MGRKRPSPSATLEERVRFYGWRVELNGCWTWLGPTNAGYGLIRVKNEMFLVHRLAYELWVDHIPDGQVIRHKCDNPPCMNPEHLETGTQADNIQDTVKRGRHTPVQGERNSHAILSSDDVKDIRDEYAKGVLTQTMLSEVYGVSQVQISRIVRNESWMHV